MEQPREAHVESLSASVVDTLDVLKLLLSWQPAPSEPGRTPRWHLYLSLETVRHSAKGSPGSSVTRLAPSWTGERPAPGALASAADTPLTAGRLGGYPAEVGVAGGSVGIPDLIFS